MAHNSNHGNHRINDNYSSMTPKQYDQYQKEMADRALKLCGLSIQIKQVSPSPLQPEKTFNPCTLKSQVQK